MTASPLQDRVEIIELSIRMGWHLDHCEWDELAGLFTDEVLVDYTSLNGGDPSLTPVKELVARWRSNRAGLTATQHLLSNQLVTIDGDTASATAMFQATHLLPNRHGGPLWTLGGKYGYGLTRGAFGWRISALAMSIIWADGNRNIRDLAAAN